MEVLPYESTSKIDTFVKYESTFESTFVRKYFRTKVRKYFRTFVLSYESTFESTKVPSKYESTKVLRSYFRTFVHIIVRVHVQQTYFHLGRYNALAGWVA